MTSFKPYHVMQTDVALEADLAFLKMQIKSFNNLVSPHHLQIRTNPPRPLNFFLRDGEGQIVGGLTAITYWTCLELEELWLHVDLRRRGYGQQLLALAEAE